MAGPEEGRASIDVALRPGGLRGVAMPAALSLPRTARGAVRLADTTSDVAVAFTLESGGGAPPEDVEVVAVDGVAIYPGALAAADVVHVARATGTEDYVHFASAPAREEVRYALDVSRAAGLHLLGRTLELLDGRGVPRLRMEPPYLIGADGRRHEAAVSVEGCAVDRGAGPAWSRPPTAPGGARCELTVSWEGSGVAYPALLDPVWTTTATQMEARSEHTSTRLPSGEVLIAGGFDPAGAALSSAEIFCPPEVCGLGIFGQTIPGGMVQARGGHTATLLDADRVLLVGGKSSQAAAQGLQSAELYNITGMAALSFTGTPNAPSSPRAEHTATKLADGRVLIAGGIGLNTAQIYHPSMGFVAPAIPMGTVRRAHVAELAGNQGKVLVAGGFDLLGFAVNTATLFDPATNLFTASGDGMTSVRAFAAAARLEDPQGSVLITGGRNELGVTFETAEIYNPTTDTFQSQLIQMQSKRAFHTATTLLGEGRVLLTGGEDGTGTRLINTEIFDLASPDAFTLATTMNYARSRHAASLLATGQVLVTGGEDPAATEHYGELLQRTNGEPCTAAGECASGLCVAEQGGICCDTPCDSLCEQCYHGPGAVENGACLPSPSGKLTTAGCKDAIEFELVCDGSGGVTPGDINDCGAYACIGPRCRTDMDGCADNSECSGDGWCNADNLCVPKQDDGTECQGANDSQCKSDHCVDGRCCESECTGQCQACDLPASLGNCSQVTGPPHGVDVGTRPACDATGTACEGTCATNPTSCDYATNTCGQSACADGLVTGGVCGAGMDGKWTCTSGSKSCEDYTCNEAGNDCRADCTETAHCAAGRVCTTMGVCAIVEETACDLDHTLVSPDGTSVDCTPYRCRGVSCIERCATVDDCVAPSVCDPEGRCVEAPGPPPEPSGCRVGTAPAAPGGGGSPLWLLVAASACALAARRGRRP